MTTTRITISKRRIRKIRIRKNRKKRRKTNIVLGRIQKRKGEVSHHFSKKINKKTQEGMLINRIKAAIVAKKTLRIFLAGPKLLIAYWEEIIRTLHQKKREAKIGDQARNNQHLKQKRKLRINHRLKKKRMQCLWSQTSSMRKKILKIVGSIKTGQNFGNSTPLDALI